MTMTRPLLLVTVFLTVSGIYYWTYWLPSELVFFAGLVTGLGVGVVARRLEE